MTEKTLEQWLEELSLLQYISAFKENDISFQLLPALTAEDLKDIGIRSVGHRRLLLDGFARLRDDQRTQTGPGHEPQTHAPVSERKFVSVLFADIKDSTAIVEGLDAEEATGRLRPALDAMVNAVHRFGGTVNKVSGDGIMALFGAPIALEDHAVRACFAALDIQHGPAETHDLQIRVGIHAGEVVVGATGTDFGHDYDAQGPAVNMAARMEQIAKPGEILITATVARLAEIQIGTQSLGEVAVKGVTEPVSVHRLTKRTAAPNRWQARMSRGLSPLRGRETELHMLCSKLSLSASGQGQGICLIGEPGIGKSRLVHELIQFAREKNWECLIAETQAHGNAVPLLPFRLLLKEKLGILDGNSTNANAYALEAAFSSLDIPNPTVHAATAAVVNLATEDPDWRALSAPDRRDAMKVAIKTLLLRGVHQKPTIIVVEDLHWLDEESQAVLDELVGHTADTPLCLLMTARPEYDVPWQDARRFTTVHLHPISDPASEALLEQLLGSDASLSVLKPKVQEATGGTPLFLEEVVRSLIANQTLIGQAGDYSLAGDADLGDIPDSIEAVLAARIDRLEIRDKVLLQQAAVIGRVTPTDILAHLSAYSSAAMTKSLERLQREELFFPDSSRDEPCYKFKHALTQDVAYKQILRSQRRLLHGKICRYIESRHHNNMEAHAAELARHAFAAEEWQLAANQYRAISWRYFENSHIYAAIIALKRSILALEKCTRTPDVQVSMSRNLALLATIDFRPPNFDEEKQAQRIERAISEAQLSGDLAAQAHAWASLCQINLIKAEYEKAAIAGKRAAKICDDSVDIGTWIRIAGTYASTLDAQGQHRAVISECTPLFLQRRDEYNAELVANMYNHFLALRSVLSAHAYCGRFAEIWWLYEINEQGRVATGNNTAKLASLSNQAYFNFLFGDFDSAERLANEAVELAFKQNIAVILRDMSLFTLIMARCELFDEKGAQAALDTLLDQPRSGTKYKRLFDITCMITEGAVAHCCGDFERAESKFDSAIESSHMHGFGRHIALLWTLKFRNATATAHEDGRLVQTAYQTAWKIAKEQDLKPLLGRLCYEYGLFLHRHGDSVSAQDNFARALAIFEQCEMPFWQDRVRGWAG